MSQQLSLELEQTIRFSANAFVLHAGVAKLCPDIETIITRKTFSLVYVVGAKHSGKTHLAAYLYERLSKAERPARSASGRTLTEWYREDLGSRPLAQGEVLIIDDVDWFLSRTQDEGTAGIFVDIVERARSAKGAVVLFGADDPESLTAGPQVRSRLISGMHLRIGNPAETELDTLLDAITKQRGILLSEGKRAYVLKRVPRDIAGLVECIERVRGISEGSLITSFQVLAGAVGHSQE